MKSDLLYNYDKIYVVGDFNYPSVRWDDEWSNNKDNEFVECLTQMVKKKKKVTRKRGGQTSNLLDLVLVNEESMVSDTEHLSPIGKSDHETLVFSLYVYEEKQKE